MYHLKCRGRYRRQLGFPEIRTTTYNYLDHRGCTTARLVSSTVLLNDELRRPLIWSPKEGPQLTRCGACWPTSHEFVDGSTTVAACGVPMNDLASTALKTKSAIGGFGLRRNSIPWVGSWETRRGACRFHAQGTGTQSVDRATLRVRWTSTTALSGVVTLVGRPRRWSVGGR